MGFRVVSKSSVTFTFETDVPLSSRHTHPSGVLHAFRSTPSAPASAGGGPGTALRVDREEHTFAWVANCLHIEPALRHLERLGFDRCRGIAFLPYSTRQNWADRHPHAEFALECADGGTCRALATSRSPPHAAAEGGGGDGPEGRRDGDGDDDAALAARNQKLKRDYNRRASTNMFQDRACIPDRERDELHIEIYNYLSWLHGKVVEAERKADVAELDQREAADGTVSEEEDMDHGEKKRAGATAVGQQKNHYNHGLDASELQFALDRLETTFLVIPNVKLEAAAAAAAAEEEEKSRLSQEQQGDERQDEDKGGTPPPQQEAPPPAPAPVPFLERELATALRQAAEAQDLAGGRKRRSRRRPRPRSDDPNRQGRRAAAGSWEDMFRRLADYKEAHGDCLVPRSRGAQSTEERQLARWVNCIRTKRSTLAQRGLDHEELPPGRKLLTKSLTAARLAQLDALGFVWSAMGPKVAWEERFREVMEYYDRHGKWPSQSMGSLGDWVHKQRQLYAKKDVNYMTHKASQLDEVGFEWTPRGNTKLTWDLGLDMLLEYGRTNGHYDVSRPSTTSEGGGHSSPEYRLYRWVESLHSMYRSYKLGRQSGSLTDERVLLLIKHGFAFRND